jgi:hypothetical protein
MMGPRWQVEGRPARRAARGADERIRADEYAAIYAVLPRQGSLTPKVRAFVDFRRIVAPN